MANVARGGSGKKKLPRSGMPYEDSRGPIPRDIKSHIRGDKTFLQTAAQRRIAKKMDEARRSRTGR